MGDETMGTMFDPAETYALSETGVVRGSDGAHIPEDEGNADWRAFLEWQASGKTASPIPVPPFDPNAVGDECKQRIFAVASTNAQVNMAAARASGVLSSADETAFADGLQWIASMRAACAALIAAEDKTYADDSHWPACPSEVAALAAKF